MEKDGGDYLTDKSPNNSLSDPEGSLADRKLESGGRRRVSFQDEVEITARIANPSVAHSAPSSLQKPESPSNASQQPSQSHNPALTYTVDASDASPASGVSAKEIKRPVPATALPKKTRPSTPPSDLTKTGLTLATTHRTTSLLDSKSASSSSTSINSKRRAASPTIIPRHNLTSLMRRAPAAATTSFEGLKHAFVKRRTPSPSELSDASVSTVTSEGYRAGPGTKAAASKDPKKDYLKANIETLAQRKVKQQAAVSTSTTSGAATKLQGEKESMKTYSSPTALQDALSDYPMRCDSIHSSDSEYLDQLTDLPEFGFLRGMPVVRETPPKTNLSLPATTPQSLPAKQSSAPSNGGCEAASKSTPLSPPGTSNPSPLTATSITSGGKPLGPGPGGSKVGTTLRTRSEAPYSSSGTPVLNRSALPTPSHSNQSLSGHPSGRASGLRASGSNQSITSPMKRSTVVTPSPSGNQLTSGIPRGSGSGLTLNAGRKSTGVTPSHSGQSLNSYSPRGIRGQGPLQSNSNQDLTPTSVRRMPFSATPSGSGHSISSMSTRTVTSPTGVTSRSAPGAGASGSQTNVVRHVSNVKRTNSGQAIAAHVTRMAAARGLSGDAAGKLLAVKQSDSSHTLDSKASFDRLSTLASDMPGGTSRELGSNYPDDGPDGQSRRTAREEEEEEGDSSRTATVVRMKRPKKVNSSTSRGGRSYDSRQYNRHSRYQEDLLDPSPFSTASCYSRSPALLAAKYSASSYSSLCGATLREGEPPKKIQKIYSLPENRFEPSLLLFACLVFFMFWHLFKVLFRGSSA